MAPDEASALPRHARSIAGIVALLLAVRFASSTALIGVNLSPPTLVTVGSALEAYEVVLALALIPAAFLLLSSRRPPVAFRLTLVVLALLGAGLLMWLLAVLGVLVPITTGVFLVLAVAAVAAVSFVAYPFAKSRTDTMRPWARILHRVLLVALPLVLAMRLAAVEGLDPVSGSAGALRGNWLFVNVPTIFLEFLVLAFFLNVLFDSSRAELRARWYAFLPFLLVPILLDAIVDRPLTAYVLSALITWGANLALFSPALYSLGLLATVVASFVSSLLLLGRRGNAASWDLLFLGGICVLFAGFYPSMASVGGLVVSVLLITASIGSWQPRAR